jgi:hypothetical protein
MEDTKKCSKCRKVKPVGEFGEYKQCSSCLDDYCKLYSKNNPGKRRYWARENVEKTKEPKQTKVHCDACEVEIQKGSWSKHIQSRDHLTNIGKDDREYFEKTKWMTCPVCNDYPIQSIKFKRHTHNKASGEFEETANINFNL